MEKATVMTQNLRTELRVRLEKLFVEAETCVDRAHARFLLTEAMTLQAMLA
jgi:hypothetical protein